MSPVFDEFSNFTNSRGQHPRIVIGSILPFDVEKNEAYQSLINHHTMTRPPNTLDYLSNTWNPWLADQAAQRGFTYLDNFAAVQQIPNWKGTLLNQSDGLHLSAAGADWVASRFVSVLVPEPSTIALVGTAVIGLLAWSLRRRKV
jgi:lysophospholipase L1-like esterase